MVDDGEAKPINTGDTVALKTQLDESCIKVLQDLGMKEDHFWSNVKLLLLSSAAIIALVAQFYPAPFPESRPLLAVCCISYLVLNVVLQLIAWLVDQDKIAVMTNDSKLDSLPAKISVRSGLARFHHMYLLQLQDAATGATVGKLHKSVGEYFTEAGLFAESIFAADVRRLTAAKKDT